MAFVVKVVPEQLGYLGKPRTVAILRQNEKISPVGALNEAQAPDGATVTTAYADDADRPEGPAPHGDEMTHAR